jgi:hypothetical protein
MLSKKGAWFNGLGYIEVQHLSDRMEIVTKSIIKKVLQIYGILSFNKGREE